MNEDRITYLERVLIRFYKTSIDELYLFLHDERKDDI